MLHLQKLAYADEVITFTVVFFLHVVFHCSTNSFSCFFSPSFLFSFLLSFCSFFLFYFIFFLEKKRFIP
ncbi:hypothetical protein BDV26DRAFT_254064 [Aspergillus bertholletiae]|uniref:Uncharacterized protein n=1 Tax=Aspergillus bertholletiae TaxID=1226010 RepID=A0A5N7BKC2_9EURO|nr:hypothetical protein BDV26DRAFT_254064 [Aspergillus bertholletiae]